MTKPRPLVIRQRAVQATMDKFGGRAFAFGAVDCGKVTAHHLRALGHKIRLSKAGQYKTLLGAQAALRRLGYATLPEAMDGFGFKRIAPAAALIGDVMSVPTDHPIGALAIVAGNGRLLGFHPDLEGLLVLEPTNETMHQSIAWRVL